jgi:hypothetical protein
MVSVLLPVILPVTATFALCVVLPETVSVLPTVVAPLIINVLLYVSAFVKVSDVIVALLSVAVLTVAVLTFAVVIVTSDPVICTVFAKVADALNSAFARTSSVGELTIVATVDPSVVLPVVATVKLFAVVPTDTLLFREVVTAITRFCPFAVSLFPPIDKLLIRSDVLPIANAPFASTPSTNVFAFSVLIMMLVVLSHVRKVSVFARAVILIGTCI